MCVPSVTRCYILRLPPHSPHEPRQQAHVTRLLGGQEYAKAASGGAARLPQSATDDARWRAERQWAEAHRPLDSVGLGPSCRASWVDRRVGVRVPGLQLSTQQRENARRLDNAARQCGASWRAWRSMRVTAGKAFDQRLIAQTHCGTRACDACARAMRDYQMARCEGDWKLFLTLTMPRDVWSCVQAWENIHESLRVFLRELRRLSYDRYETIIDNKSLQESGRFPSNQLIQNMMRGEEKLEYAWVLEAHEDGYPHVHMVVNQEYIDYNWIRDNWGAAVGALSVNIEGEVITNKDGACRYLSQYIAKARLSLDILAVIKGRRIWWSTAKNIKRPDAKWIPEGFTPELELERQIEDASEWGINEEWRVVSKGVGRYALWERVAIEPHSVRVITEAIEFASENSYDVEIQGSVQEESEEFWTVTDAFWRLLERDREKDDKTAALAKVEESC